MTDKELLEQANNLQTEAKRVLEELELISFLKKYSNPKIVGSAANGLMALQDVDIHCYTETPNLEDIVEIIQKLIFIPTVQMVHFNNYQEFRRDYNKISVNFPLGYYLGFRSIQPSGEWKIDMWFKKENDPKEYDSSKLDSLSNEQRVAILRLKQQFKQGKGYKDGALSVDFYKAVLEKSIRSEEEFSEYLSKKASTS